jgi:saxitoxin biosynthesis operon SxtJ-like protein
LSRPEIPELDTKGLRQFGLILGGILAVVFGLLLPWKWGWSALPNWYWIGGGAVIAAWALFDAGSMRGLYRAWMRLAMAIGSVVNAVVLAIVFFLLITPMGLLSRMMGKDPMRRSLDPNAGSYRVKSKVAKREHMARTY